MKFFLRTNCPLNYSQIWKFSLHYLQNCQNYATFSQGNLAVETLLKIVSTIEGSVTAISMNTF